MRVRCTRCGEVWDEPATWIGRWWRRRSPAPKPGGKHWFIGGGYDPTNYEMPGWCGPVEEA